MRGLRLSGRRGYPGSSEEDGNQTDALGEAVYGVLGAERSLGTPFPREEGLRALETRVEHFQPRHFTKAI